MQEFDEPARLAALQEATKLVFAETPVVPLYWQKLYWGTRDGLTVKGGLNEYTLPQDVERLK